MVTKYEYDKLYSLTKTIEDHQGLNITTTREYDLLGRLVRIIDSKNQAADYLPY